MQLLEAPQKTDYLAQPPSTVPSTETTQALSTIELARNLTPEAKRILRDVAGRNAEVAEITAQTAQGIDRRLH
jgi:hypothetical protein